MSKSKGNVVTPPPLIEERGTDAVRYWAGTSRLGGTLPSRPTCSRSAKTVGKLWNATQFAAIHLDKLQSAPTSAKMDMETGAIGETIDRWILSRLAGPSTKQRKPSLGTSMPMRWMQRTIFSGLISATTTSSSSRSASTTKKEPSPPPVQQSAVRALYYCLDGILKLYAPFTLHVTEELFSNIFADAYANPVPTYPANMWPKSVEYLVDNTALEMGTQALVILSLIRSEKSSTNPLNQSSP